MDLINRQRLKDEWRHKSSIDEKWPLIGSHRPIGLGFSLNTRKLVARFVPDKTLEQAKAMYPNDVLGLLPAVIFSQYSLVLAEMDLADIVQDRSECVGI